MEIEIIKCTDRWAWYAKAIGNRYRGDLITDQEGVSWYALGEGFFVRADDARVIGSA